MSKIDIECHDDNPPAFPRVGFVSPEDNEPISGNLGMTLRDYFAAAVLQGWLASWPEQGTPHPALSDNALNVARLSYSMADAMLAARKEVQP